MVRLGAPVFTPDGRTIILKIVRPDYDANIWKSQFISIDIATKEQQILEFKQTGIGQLMFSPDGKHLSFLAPAGTEGNPRPQVHIIPFPGGEAECITSSPTGVGRYAWNPKGNEIAYLAEDPEPPKPENEKYVTAFEVGNNGYLETSPPLPSHIWLVPTSGGNARRLTSGQASILSAPVWSPDGLSIAFVRGISPFPGDSNSCKIEILRVSDNEIRALTGNAMLEEDPSFSPHTGNPPLLSYLFPLNGNPAAIRNLYIFPVGGNGKPHNLTASLDRSILSKDWMPDGNSLLVTAPDGTKDGMWQVPLKGKPIAINLGDIKSIYGVTVNPKGGIALVGSTSYRPSELYYLPSPNAAPVRLTDFHAEVAALDLGKTETIEWEGGDGMKADGIVTYPPDFSAQGKYPLVLLIHGGPTAFSDESFSPLEQVMAARGWVVFSPNYRGSSHRGNDFQLAIMNDAAEGPGRDVMAGIGALKKRGFIDEKRIAVSGWSYGGFMTAWLIGRYPDVWKTAVAGAAPVDVTDMTSLSMMNAMIRHAITSSPWTGDNFNAYFDQSPIKYLSRVRTPTLIMSKTGDSVVTITGSYKLYHALKANGVPVQFIAYPGPGHSPGDPVNSRDVYQRWLAWLEKYL